MIITCPSCSTRYPVEASSFAPSGRKVRCAKCGHSWHQAPPTDLPGKAEEDFEADGVGEAGEVGDVDVAEKTAVAPAEVSEAEPVFPAGPQKPLFKSVPKFEPEPAAEAEGAAEAEEPMEVAFADEHVRPATSGGRLRAHLDNVASSRRGRVLGMIGWAVLLLFVGGTVFAAVQYRREIVALWPKTVTLYAAAGAPVNLRGLEFRDVGYERQSENGLPVLAVTGKVVNVSGETQALPRLRVGLSDANSHELYHWTFALPEKELQPKASASFTTRLSSPPVGARDLEVRFVLKGEDTQVPAAPEQTPPANPNP